MDESTEYFLENIPRICKSDYKPTDNDIKMIKQYYAENVRIEEKKHLFEFYNCELNPSKWSQLYQIKCAIFIIDLTCYHRTIINPKTNNQINEMQYILSRFTDLCQKFCYKHTRCVFCFPVRFWLVFFFFFCVFSETMHEWLISVCCVRVCVWGHSGKQRTKNPKLKSCRAFKTVPFLLYFNKKDIFTEKLEEFPLENAFNDYKGDTHFNAIDFICQKFMEIAENSKVNSSRVMCRRIITRMIPREYARKTILKKTFAYIGEAS